MYIKRAVKNTLFVLLILLFASCSNSIDAADNSPWTGNWYGYIGESFYKLSFTGKTACLYYTSSSGGYLPLYEAAAYEYTSKSFNVEFTTSAYGERLSRNMDIYGTMIPDRNDGFYLWNSTSRPFFKLD